MKMPNDEALVDETIATLLSQNPKIITDGSVQWDQMTVVVLVVMMMMVVVTTL